MFYKKNTNNVRANKKRQKKKKKKKKKKVADQKKKHRNNQKNSEMSEFPIKKPLKIHPQARDLPRIARRDLDRSLIALNFADRIKLRDSFANGHMPLCNFALGNAFADISEIIRNLNKHTHTHTYKSS
jgi:hypothetical protein